MAAMILIVLLFLTGLWGLIERNNLIRKVIALNILSSAVTILFVYYGSLSGRGAPILLSGIWDIVDPIPQALMLTAIVIGVSLTALGLALVYRIYLRFGTLDIREIEREMRRNHE